MHLSNKSLIWNIGPKMRSKKSVRKQFWSKKFLVQKSFWLNWMFAYKRNFGLTFRPYECRKNLEWTNAALTKVTRTHIKWCTWPNQPPEANVARMNISRRFINWYRFSMKLGCIGTKSQHPRSCRILNKHTFRRHSGCISILPCPS